MGKKQASGAGGVRPSKLAGLQSFTDALRQQLADRQRVVRAFDIGGSGVKTGLFSAPALREFLHFEGAPPEPDAVGAEPEELEWIEPPASLGEAPGERGFAAWLAEQVPRLRREVDDPHVCFGVSVGGDVDHATGKINDWWPGGGHPRQWDDGIPSPLVANLMGLPPARTFVLHDGEAHLLGCSRSALPPPNLACLALGTGVGIGLTDGLGAVVDSTSPHGERSYCLSGIPLSGAPYKGVWRQWLERPGGSNDRVDEVMEKPFANVVSTPWRIPWVSLVLGRRGMELAEAAHGCPPPCEPKAEDADEAEASGNGAGSDAPAAEDPRMPAVRAYGEQWLHFLYTQFIPQFTGGTRRHPVEKLVFAGGVMEHNWPGVRGVMLEPGQGRLRPLPPGLGLAPAAAGGRPASKRGRGAAQGSASAADAADSLTVLPLAPRGSGLIGAGLYALAGMGGGAAGIWAA